MIDDHGCSKVLKNKVVKNNDNRLSLHRGWRRRLPFLASFLPITYRATSLDYTQQRCSQSMNYQRGRVINRMPRIRERPSTWHVFWSYLGGRYPLKPKQLLPYQSLDVNQLAQAHRDLRMTWLGHSSLFIEIEGVRVLTDPVFQFASPSIVKGLFNRNLPAPCDRTELPLPDVIVISHDHYDHLEKSTIRYFSNKPVTFLVPLGVGKHLRAWGVAAHRIQEFDWWQKVILHDVEFICTPANHNSGRSWFDHNTSLWASWVFKGKQRRVYFSGDSAYDDHFTQIGACYGPFDVACIEVAANVKSEQGFPVENWGHMQADHTVQAFQDLNADKLLPIHWATYELFTHKWNEPIVDLLGHAELALEQVMLPLVGQSFIPEAFSVQVPWWEEVCYSGELKVLGWG